MTLPKVRLTCSQSPCPCSSPSLMAAYSESTSLRNEIIYIKGKPFELAECQVRVFEKRIDKISDGFSMINIDRHLVLHHKGLVNRYLLENVAYFLTI